MALENIDTSVSIVDGRVAMSADADATLHVERPLTSPLSASERHATLRFEGDSYRVEVTLDADECAWLEETLAVAQGGAHE